MATASTRSKAGEQQGKRSSAGKASKASSNGSHGRAAATRATRSSRSSKASTRSSSNGNGSSGSSSASRTRGRSKSGSASGRTKTAQAKGTSNGTSHSMRERASETMGPALENVGGVAKQVGLSVATGTIGAAAGVAGGVLLGRTAAAKKPRKVLGVKLPTQRKADVDFSGLSQFAKSVNQAGKQFGKLAGEVREARQKAEEIGKALS